jgi:type II secretion system protein E
MAQKTLPELLLSSKIATQEQLDDCVQINKKTGKTLESCLVEKKLSTPQDIAKLYADYASMHYIETISDEMADPTLLSQIPLKFLRTNIVIPVVLDGIKYVVAANPTNFQILDEVNIILGGDLRYAIAPYTVIIDSINRYYPLESGKEMIESLEKEEDIDKSVELAEIEETDILSMASEAPIIKLVNSILYQAVKRGASDIHIEPFEKEVRVRFRIDGVMYDIMHPPKRLQGALASRLKIMANLNIAEKRVPQDGRIQIKIAGKLIDIRVSVLPVAHGERIVMRLLDKSKTFGEIEDMGFSDRDIKIIIDNIDRPNGIIYVTGPTGSGKSTTLYSILGRLNKSDSNIITVEDPVEYQMAGIGQVQVKEKVGMTFAAALRSILRQDPDIVMIGETRDQETAQIAIQAALTGHLVLSTLHTNSAPASITRLIDMGIEPFLIASSVIMVIAQRLVRRLCNECKQQHQPEQEMIDKLGIEAEEQKIMTFYKAVGCSECLETGYRGRLAIYEVMQMTAGIAKLSIARADTAIIRTQAVKDGMTQLVADGARKIGQGITTIEEVLAVATMEYSVEE